MKQFREIPMHGSTAVRAWPRAAVRAGFIALATMLVLAASPVPAANKPPASASDTQIKVTPFPPSVQVDAGAAGDDSDNDTARGKHHHAVIRLDSDRDFESFKNAVNTAPWIVGLVFLVVGSIFLTPVILLVGIVWYKLRKTRLQNEALLKLAESGVMPAGQAVDAVASGVMPAASAIGAAGATGNVPTSTLQQTVIATRRRAVWSDLRKGILLCAFGLSLTAYWMIEHGSASWLGLMLLFVGVGYIVLWWLEDRHLAQNDSREGSG
jgi:hypothetical protein